MRILIYFFIAIILTTPGFAAQTVSVAPNGEITIRAAVNGITRISVAGDRIRRLIADNSQTKYQSQNDPETGDLFLKTLDGAGTESGFLVTEKGYTLGFTVSPTNSRQENVLITVAGTTSDSSSAGPSLSSLAAPTAQSGAIPDIVGGGYTASITTAAKEVINKHVLGRAIPSRSDGSVVATERVGSLTVQVIVVRAGNSGGVREQSYYSDGVLGVWIGKTNLSPGERTFGLIVRK